MKGKLITLLGFIYVTYALATAYAALDRIETTPPPSAISGEAQPRGHHEVHQSWRPMDFVDQETFADVRGRYRIVIWKKSGCYWCDKFEKREVPKLKKSGTPLETKWYGEDKPEEGQAKVKYFPTIRIYNGKILVKEFRGYTKADEILKHVKQRVILLK